MSRLPTTAPPRSHAPRGNAVLAAPAARAATPSLPAPASAMRRLATLERRHLLPRWSVGARRGGAVRSLLTNWCEANLVRDIASMS